MVSNFFETFIYLDNLINQKLDKIKVQNEFKFFSITSEEIKNSLLKYSKIKSDSFYLPSLSIIEKIFQLSDFEKKALLIILAPEIDSKYERIYAYLQDDLTRKYPTISLISLLLCKNEKEKEKIVSYFLPTSPLLKFKLVRIEDNGTSFLSSPIRVEESVRNFLLGYYTLDKRLNSFCKIIPPISTQKISTKIFSFVNSFKEVLMQNKKLIIYLYGPEESEKNSFALQIASALGYGILKVNTLFILNDFEELLKIIFREALLSGTLVYFDNFDALLEHEKFFLYEHLFLNISKDFCFLVFCNGKNFWQPKIFSEHYFLSFSFNYLNYEKSHKIWEKYLKEINPEIKEYGKTLAKLFNFSEEEIKQIISLVKAQELINRRIDESLIYRTCRNQVKNKLSNLAQQLKLPYNWDDIILPEDQLSQLKDIANSFRYQYQVFESWGFKRKFINKGLCALFTGSPGTGKTMAASIIANELGLDLYRIELSRVVSKYIGETEKNLAQIFDAAEGAGVVLFFDEADAIFGKRTEVKDAHDRYANIEVSYLLQRIEEYNGLVILATNFRRNIDEAFIRRMHFIVEFPFPDEEMRKKIWKKVFPKEAPLAKNIDFEFLAKNFKLSGGNIRNVALASAFYAAKDKGEITMEHIMKGMKRELQKMGKNISTCLAT